MASDYADVISDAKHAATEGHPDNPVPYDLRGAIEWAQTEGYRRRLNGDVLNKEIVDAVVRGDL